LLFATISFLISEDMFLTDFTATEEYADKVFPQIPDNAIVILPTDQPHSSLATKNLQYFAYAEQHRPDIILVNPTMFDHKWYIQNLQKKMEFQHKESLNTTINFLQSNNPQQIIRISGTLEHPIVQKLTSS
ncbi:hypothetical protein ACFL0V_06020, partial [Nanoarchaeota archaeon]